VPRTERTPWLLAAVAVSLALLVISGVRPYDRFTWFLEVVPVLIALAVMLLTYRRAPLTSLLYFLAFWHAAVLMLGGAYTYARVPLGFELQDMFALSRNPYDRIGHFFQGFVPAIAVREVLLRMRVVNGRRMLVFLVICVVLAISASYELIEWAAALAAGEGAEDFLGTQGDVWDTQSDMFMALLGAVVALLSLSRLHDRQLANLPGPRTSS
jgi:putative membrane protein